MSHLISQRFYPDAEILFVGDVECRSLRNFGESLFPECFIDLALSAGSGVIRKLFKLPIANLGDSRLEAQADDGMTLKAYRLDYD